jgi:2-hydroxy-3-keto-5-methylthiopentenyl-1-phosphate phosphatase
MPFPWFRAGEVLNRYPIFTQYFLAGSDVGGLSAAKESDRAKAKKARMLNATSNLALQFVPLFFILPPD